ncbi:hypothetical protein [Streptomyces sp. NRRL S-118]|uniref:hypothetical protein n=1 Tax=Streptomyces sp. NRRL S-118 TaxID=1463881 RepID=UPI0004C770B3|nr:hypothetical protein [Streptomyces sp. NRRL S-118]
MEPELVALATTGATALVQLMVGETWEQARGRIATFFARRAGSDPEAVGEELDTVREELLTAAESGDERTTAEARDDARVEWRARIRRTLQADPEAAAELREILDQLAPTPSVGQTTVTTYNRIDGGVHHAPVIQSGFVGTMKTPWSQRS